MCVWILLLTVWCVCDCCASRRDTCCRQTKHFFFTVIYFYLEEDETLPSVLCCDDDDGSFTEMSSCKCFTFCSLHVLPANNRLISLVKNRNLPIKKNGTLCDRVTMWDGVFIAFLFPIFFPFDFTCAVVVVCAYVFKTSKASFYRFYFWQIDGTFYFLFQTILLCFLPCFWYFFYTFKDNFNLVLIITILVSTLLCLDKRFPSAIDIFLWLCYTEQFRLWTPKLLLHPFCDFFFHAFEHYNVCSISYSIQVWLFFFLFHRN